MKTLSSWILIGFLLAPQAMAAAGVGIYHFDEGAGATLGDASGLGNHGVLTQSAGGTASWTTGVLGSALEFSGLGGRVLVPHDASLQSADALTIAAWVRPTQLKTQYIVKKGRLGVADGFELALSSTGLAFVRLNNVSAGNAYKIFSTSSYPTDGNTWIHLAATFDGAEIRLYVDGVLEGALAAPGLSIGSNSFDLSIGAEDDGGGWLLGAVDDVHLYDHAASPADIANLVANGELLPDADADGVPDIDDAFPDDPTESSDIDADGIGDNADPDDDGDSMVDDWELANGFDPSNPSDAAEDADEDGFTNLEEYELGFDPRVPEPVQVAHWSFDDAVGATATDASGFAHHGDLAGAPSWIVGTDEGALQFPGDGSRVVVQDSSDLDFAGGMTVVAWVRPEVIRTQDIVRKADLNAVDGFELALSSTGAAFVRFNQKSALDQFKLLANSPYPTDGSTWMHVAASFDGQTIRMYIDGALEASLAAPGLIIGANTQPLSIAATPDGARGLQGAVDDVRIFDRSLSGDAIANLMASGSIYPDSDGDGVPDDVDVFWADPDEWSDTDGDGIGDNADSDDDGDGMPDVWEVSFGFGPLDPQDADVDTDGDGASNLQEFLAGTNPLDRDGDGVVDADDAFPNDPSEWIDTDADGSGDNSDLDDDGDGMPDSWELSYGLAPLDAGDALGDADADGVDNLSEFALGTLPGVADTDGDTRNDGSDAFPLDPTEWIDTDGDAAGDNADTDDDGDGMPDVWEAQYGFDALDFADGAVDTDGDGVSNVAEFAAGTHPLDRDGDFVADAADAFPDDATEWIDTDGDAVGDNADTDDDDDGMPDAWETLYGLDPLSAADAQIDLDADGVVNYDELLQGTSPLDADSDADGSDDGVDAFPVNAGESLDTDSDGTGNNADLDDDGDGLPDSWELLHGFDPLTPGEDHLDTDSDGLDSLAELDAGTDPHLADTDADGTGDAEDAFPTDVAEWRDTDGDGVGDNADLDDDGDSMPDSWELQYGFDALDPADALIDSDGDGVDNAAEHAAGTHPRDRDGDFVADAADAFPDDAAEWDDTDFDGIGNNADLDDDGDGMPDSFESAYGFDSLDASDASLDADSDASTNLQEFTAGTGPLTADSDGDGVLDGADVFPTDASEWDDTDADGIGNNTDLDDDADGLPDVWEVLHGYDPLAAGEEHADLDGDGLDSTSELELGTNPTVADTDLDGTVDGADAFPLDAAEWLDLDSDGIGNNADLDDDGDGMPDVWESGFGLDPLDAADAALDSDGDGHSNLAEFGTGTDPLDRDEDGYQDANDAFPNDPDEWIDTDSDGTGNNADLDDDGDTMPDAWELARGFDPLVAADALADADADGASNALEFAIGSDPHNADTDGDGYQDGVDAFSIDSAEWHDTDADGTGNNADLDDDADGMPDSWELQYGFDPLAAFDANLDTDGDFIINLDEYLQGTHPLDRDGDFVADVDDVFPDDPTEWIDTDSDGTGDNADLDDDADAMPDAWEQEHGFDPLSPADALQDPDADGASNATEFALGTDPNVADSDADGTLDGGDSFPMDPAEWVDTDGDGTGDNADLDDDADGLPDVWEIQNDLDTLDPSDAALDNDSDGLTNLQEFLAGTVAGDADSDDDGVVDGQDAFPLDATEWADVDADGVGNNADLDADADGLTDAWESANGLDPNDASDAVLDADGDGLSNSAEYAAGSDPHSADTDGDGVGDASDAFPSDPSESSDLDADGIGDLGDPDTDGDGMPETWEMEFGLDPLDPSDGSLDLDADGLSNLEEYIAGSHPFVAPEIGPVAHWRFDEGSGADVGDDTGAHDGSIVGSPEWKTGLLAGAIRLTSGDRVTVSDAAALDFTNQLTMSAWLRPDDTTTQYVIKKARHDLVDGYELSLSSSGNVYVRFNQASEGDTWKLLSTSSYPSNSSTWIHVAATFDGSVIALYVDGVLESTLAAPGLVVSTNNIDLSIGAQDDGVFPFNGAIDDVHLYDRALDTVEIQTVMAEGHLTYDSDGDGIEDVLDAFPNDATEWRDSDGDGAGDETDIDDDGDGISDGWELLVGLDPRSAADASADPDGDGILNAAEYTAGTNPFDLPPSVPIGSWSFEEGQGDLAVDGTGLGHDGVLIGAPAVVTGMFGSALEFNGLDQRVRIDDAADLDLTGPFTLSAWLRPEVVGTQHVVKKAAGVIDGYELSLSSSGQLFVRFNADSNGDTFKVLSTSVYPTDGVTWVHAAVTYDGSQIRFYVNGVLENTKSASSLTIGSNALPLTIGAHEDAAFSYLGSVDDVHVMGRALPADELELLRTTGGLHADSDGDGTGDANDAFPADASEWSDADADGSGDLADPDDDSDGLPDTWELAMGLDPYAPSSLDTDSDDDGLNVFGEWLRGTDPNVADSDGDGLSDLVDPYPTDGAESADTDSDGIGDNADTDADGDGIPNDWEILYGLDPLDSADATLDTDGDGTINYAEWLLGTNPIDSDGDGVIDSEDVFPFDGTEWLDFDGDGLGDNADPDRDGDGLPNSWEAQYGLDALDPSDAAMDTDGDGAANLDEFVAGTHPLDRDGDFVADANDAFPDDSAEWMDTDLDGIGNNADLDDDADGMPDAWELSFGFDAIDAADAAIDSDADGSSNHAEFLAGTHPLDADSDDDATQDGSDPFPLDPSEWADLDADGIGNNADADRDGDGMPNDWEAQYGFGDLDAGDGLVDTDGDGVSNIDEYLAATHPLDRDGDFVADLDDAFPDDASEWIDTDVDGTGDNADLDDDGDGMPDVWEISYGFDSLNAEDASGDPDSDLVSNVDEFAQGTSPLAFDSDGDGSSDAADVFPTNAAEWVDTDADGIGNNADLDDDADSLPDVWEIEAGFDSLDPANAPLDADSDGLTNLQEFALGTDPVVADTDADGVLDGADVFPLDSFEWIDTDGDGIGDNVDLDADADGLPDAWEIANGLDPLTPASPLDDTDADGLSDLDEFSLGSDPQNADTDADGVADGADAVPTDADESGDLDGDGIGDLADTDDDGDGMADHWELAFGLDPLNPNDANGDLDADGATNLDEFLLGTDPLAGPDDGSVGHWPLDAAAGAVAYDTSTHTNDGALTGGPVWTSGVFGAGLDVASGSRVLIPDSAELDFPGEFSLAVWVRPSVKATQYVLKKARLGAVDGYEVGLSSNGQVYARFNEASAGNTYKLFSSTNYPTNGNDWLHIATTFDGQTLRLYLDGVLRGSQSAANLVVSNNDLALSLGAQDDGVSPFDGGIDDLFLFDRALLPEEVAQLAVSGTVGDSDGDGVSDASDPFPSDPMEWLDSDADGLGDNHDGDDDGDGIPDAWEIATGLDPNDASDAGADPDEDGDSNLVEFEQGSYPFSMEPHTVLGTWTFDEGAGATTADASGFENEGAFVGSPSWTDGYPTAGVPGSGLAFNGSSSRVEIADSAALDVANGLTLAAWIRPSAVKTQYVVKKALPGVDGYELSLSSTGVWFARFNESSDGNDHKVLSASNYPTNGSWRHVAVTFDGQTIRLFEDGSLVRSAPAGGLTIGVNALPVVIGAQQDGFGTFQGSIDEVHIIDRALSQLELAELIATGGLGGDADGDLVPDDADAFPMDPAEWADADADGVGDAADLDDDGDGIPDVWELAYGLDPYASGNAHEDADGDGISNLGEWLRGTLPLSPDTDGDGVDDLSDSFATDATESVDTDHDGIGNNTDSDDDQDGLPDVWELQYGFDPLNPSDSIGDADADGVSNLVEFAYGRNPLDNDEDGYEDAVDAFPSDASEWNDHDADGIGDNGDPDDDADGMTDEWEALYGFDSMDPADGPLDTDGDGVSNADEFAAGTHPLDRDGDFVADSDDVFPDDPSEWSDTDGDTIGDNADLDDDADGLTDEWELLYGFDPLDAADALLDTDTDGSTNLEEYAVGTDPLNPDTDADGTQDAADHFPHDPSEWTDTDADGIGNNADLDDDGDGLPDVWEQGNGLDPLDGADAATDTDVDGLSNTDEYILGTDPANADSDGDGAVDGSDHYPFDPSESLDTDGDGLGNNADLDDDGDLLPDVWEIANGLDPLDPSDGMADSDGDGVTNDAEMLLGSHPLLADTDGDGVNDGLDGFVLDGTEWADADADGTGDNADLDDDNDGLPDTWEIQYGLDPYDASDATLDLDGDGANNLEEFAAGSHPWDADGDGVTDPVDAFPHDPTEWSDVDGDGTGNNADIDDDGDGMPDSFEISNGLNPLDASDAAADADADGLANLEEFRLGTGMQTPDTDADGTFDGADAFPHLAGEIADTDADGIADAADPDDDGDGMPDIWEVRYGLNPVDASDGAADANDDGVTNLGEYAAGKHPQQSDLVVIPQIAQWTFEEGVGTTVTDASGNGHLATFVDLPTWTAGVNGGGLAFDGVNDSLSVVDDPIFDFAGGMTLAVWLRPEVRTTQYVVKKARHTSVDGFELSLSNTGKPYIRINQPTSSNAYKLFAASDYPRDGLTWMHLAATFDGSALRMYVNGVLETSLAAPGLVISPNSLPLSIGSQDDGVSPFIGTMDDLRIYDGALSDTALQAVMAGEALLPDTDRDTVGDLLDTYPNDVWESGDADLDGLGDRADVDADDDGIPDGWETAYGLDALDAGDAIFDTDGDGVNNLDEYTAGTAPHSEPPVPSVGSWRLDDAVGAVALDTSDAANHGAFAGTPTWSGGVHAGGLSMSGGSDRVIIPDHASLDLTTGMTLAAWLRPASGTTQYLVKKANASTDGYELSLSSSGRVFVRLNQASYGSTYKIFTLSNFPTNGITWMHVAASFDGSTIRLYVDGELEVEVAAPGLTIGTNDLPLSIGAEANGNRPFVGGVDDVHVFATALSESQISGLVATSGLPIDSDADGVLDSHDMFPADPSGWADLDADGIADGVDSDADGDGMPDTWELAQGFDPFDPEAGQIDADGDGLTNLGEFLRGTDPFSVDTDADGVNDAQDGFPTDPSESLDSDGDAVADSLDLDDDGDLLPDAWELLFGLDPTDASDADIDTDGDGISNLTEYLTGTLPTDRDNDGIEDLADTFPDDPSEWQDSDSDGTGDNADLDDDGDGLPDAFENAYGFDSLDATDAATDADFDGLSNLEEYLAGSNPLDRDGDGVTDFDDAFPDDPSEWLDTDSDGTGNNADLDDDADGMPDSWELANGLNPILGSDAAGDPDMDGLDNLTEFALGTLAQNSDTDADGSADALDAFPLDGAEWLDTDGDGTGNNADLDDDGDGIPDSWELGHGLDPLVASDAAVDFDSDGLVNVAEYAAGTDPSLADSDGDSMPDGWEVLYGLDPLSPADANLDPDADGDSNLSEYLAGTNPTQGAAPQFDGIAHWSLDEGTGTATADSSGNGHAGVMVGSPAWANGVYGKAVRFDGSGEQVVIPHDPVFDVEYVTVAAWVRPSAQDSQAILRKARRSLVDGIEFSLSANGFAYIRLNHATFGNTFKVYATTPYPTDGTWVHVAASFDGEYIRFYTDGVLETTDYAGTLAIGTNTLPVTIGAQDDGADSFEGSIDDVHVFDYALSEAEIGMLMLGESQLPDADADGVPDQFDAFPLDPTESIDSDSDGTGDNADLDDDDDGMPDVWELQYVFDPIDASDAAGDEDHDGITNLEEYLAGTNPKDLGGPGVNLDSDGDGMPNSFELFYGLDPNDPTDAALDSDGDGVSNVGEFLQGTNPITSAGGPQSGDYFVQKGTGCTATYPSCGTELAPFDDIDHCASILVAGETCWVMDGTYTKGIDSEDGRPYQPANSGTPGNPIRLMAYPGHKPLIRDVSGITWNFGIGDRRHYITFSGFRVDGVVRVEGSHESSRSTHIVVENFEICGGGGKDDGNWSAIFAEYVEDITIRHNIIRDVKSSSGSGQKGMSIFNGRRTIVEHNYFMGNPSEGVFDKEGGEDNVYRRNIFQDNKIGLKINNQSDGNGLQNVGTQIYENIFYCSNDSFAASIRMLVEPTDWNIYNNAGYNCNAVVVRSNSGPATGGVIYNNAWTEGNGDSLIYFESWNDNDREPDYMDYNLWKAGGRFRENRFHSESEDHHSLASWNSVAHPLVYDTNSIEADPLFENPEQGDFHLSPGSPGLGTGVNGEDMGAYPRRDGTVIGPANGTQLSDTNGGCFESVN